MKKPPNLPPGLRVRRGKYHYRFIVAGHEYSGSTGYAATARNLTLASRKLEQLRQQVETGDAGSIKLAPTPFNSAVATFLDWAEGEYKKQSTAKRLRTSCASLLEYFDRTLLHTIHAGNIETFKAWRRSCEIKDITIRKDLHCLSLIFQFGIKHNWCRRNIVRDVQIPSDRDAVREHVFTEDEEAIYFAAAARFPALHDLALLMLHQGIRPEEGLAMRKSAVNLAERTMKIDAGKTPAARRTLRLTDASLEVLRRRCTGGDSPWVFPGRASHLTKLNNQHAAVRTEIGIPCVLYDFRHTFATRMAVNGCPLPTLAKIMGHANLRTLERYVHPSAEAAHDAMEKYGAKRSGIGPGTPSQTGNSKSSSVKTVGVVAADGKPME